MGLGHSVLLYGNDRSLVELRAKVLAVSGFEATAATGSAEVLELIRTEDFQLMILCQTLSDEECLVSLKAAAMWRPGMKKLVLTHGARNLPRELVDGECNPTSGPECLLRETALLLNIAPRLPARPGKKQG